MTQISTPTPITPDDAEPSLEPKAKPAKDRKTMPNRGIRKRLLGNGEGDYCIYEIAPRDSDLPAGSLIPIPDVPRFGATTEATRWIRNNSGSQLAGKQVMVLRAMEIMTIRVESRAAVTIESKPRVNVERDNLAQT